MSVSGSSKFVPEQVVFSSGSNTRKWLNGWLGSPLNDNICNLLGDSKPTVMRSVRTRFPASILLKKLEDLVVLLVLNIVRRFEASLKANSPIPHS